MNAHSLQPCHDESWYLIHCQPRKELFAAIILEKRLALSIFLPEYEICSRGNQRRLPFFPGYFFVQADLRKVPLSQINTTPGVRRLVDFGGDPQIVPTYVIEEIARRLKQAQGFSQPSFRSGDRVRVIQEGPLQDLEMIFIGSSTSSRRVSVLLNLLGRTKEVLVDITTLEKILDKTL